MMRWNATVTKGALFYAPEGVCVICSIHEHCARRSFRRSPGPMQQSSSCIRQFLYSQLESLHLSVMQQMCKSVRRLDKKREHAAALEVLPDLLHELDQMPSRARLTSLIQGILAGNIFDWGAKATVDLYHNGTILEIYR